MRTASITASIRAYRSLWARLVRARRVLLVSPPKPDGDSIGSICGLGAALESVGVAVTRFCQDPIPEQFDGIPGVHEIQREILVADEHAFDAIVVVDASDFAFAGIADDLPRWRAQGGVLIVIDHHRTNTMYGDVNCVDRAAASTTEVITRILEASNIPLTARIAQCLYYGLVTDTDSFTNPAMSASAAATAARLCAAGARPGPVLEAAYRRKPIGALQLWGSAFTRLRIHPRWDVAVCVLLPEDFITVGDAAEHAEGLSNFLQTVLPARAILVLKDRGDGTVRGSLRTVRDGVELGKLAAFLGGGGHRKASGFGVPGRLVPCGTSWRVER